MFSKIIEYFSPKSKTTKTREIGIELQYKKNENEYKNWKIGDFVSRKGVKCKIIKIHHETYPPSLTIKKLNDNTEINTEYIFVKYIHSENNLKQNKKNSRKRRRIIFDDSINNTGLRRSKRIRKNDTKKIERILRKKTQNGNTLYYVKWIGFPNDYGKFLSEQEILKQNNGKDIIKFYKMRVKRFSKKSRK